MSNETAVAVPERIQLDEVMLAMDVVDTLRHQQDLVDQALAQDSRDAALTARIRAIYAEQGIEVPDSVIAEGVEALKKDRFVYQPPVSGFGRRLAHLYIDRWRWIRNLSIAGVIGVVAWGAYEAPRQIEQNRRVTAQTEQLQLIQARLGEAENRLGEWRRQQQTIALPAAPLHVAGQRLSLQAGSQANRAEEALKQARAVTPPNPRNNYPSAFERALTPLLTPLTEAEQALDAAEKGLAELGQLGSLANSLQQAQALLAGVTMAPSVRNEVDTIRRQAESALQAGEVALARGRIERLNQIGAVIDLNYQLRIVSRPDVQSGVWRHPVDNPGGRNYYIIVDAIGADGQPLALPITSEEDQQTRTVSRFGVRVPERVYEQVRADKQDNGLIDQSLFGEKRRGELDPRYHFAVAGGHITQW